MTSMALIKMALGFNYYTIIIIQFLSIFYDAIKESN